MRKNSLCRLVSIACHVAVDSAILATNDKEINFLAMTSRVIVYHCFLLLNVVKVLRFCNCIDTFVFHIIHLVIQVYLVTIY